MGDLDFSFQNVIDANGIAIAITGMSIVFAALVLISVFVALLPRLLTWTHAVLPEKPAHTPPAKPKSADADTALIAAIGVALHRRGGSGRGADN